jgi:hypothetical protein
VDRDIIENILAGFTRTVSQTCRQMTLKLSGIQANVPVDAKVFAKPATAR